MAVRAGKLWSFVRRWRRVHLCWLSWELQLERLLRQLCE